MSSVKVVFWTVSGCDRWHPEQRAIATLELLLWADLSGKGPYKHLIGSETGTSLPTF